MMKNNSIFNKSAFVLIIVIVAFSTLVYGAVHQAVLAVVYVLIAALLLLWVIDGIRSGSVRYSKSMLQIPLLGAAIYGFIQIVPFGVLPNTAGVENIPRTISLEPFATQISATHFVALLIFFSILLTLIDSVSRLRKLVIFIAVFGFAYAFFAVLQSVLSPDKIYGIYGRQGANPFGSFVNRNHFAAWIELAAAIPLGLLFSGVISKDKRLLYITSIALMGVALLISGSRGGLVAFVVEILFLLLITYASGQKRKTGLQWVLAAGLLIAVVAGSIFVGGETSLSRIGEEQAPGASSSQRSHIWAVTLKMIGDSMPLGVGLGAFGTAFDKYDTNSGLERVEQAHNDYLQVVSDAGVFGAILGAAFLFFIYRTVRKGLRAENGYRRAVAAGASAGLTAVLIHSVFDFVLHTTAVALLFLTVLAILVASQINFEDDEPDVGANVERERRRRRSSFANVDQPQ